MPQFGTICRSSERAERIPVRSPNDFSSLPGSDRELTKRTQAEVVYMLRCKFEHGWSDRRIAVKTDLHHSTVGGVVNAAKAVEPSLAAYD